MYSIRELNLSHSIPYLYVYYIVTWYDPHQCEILQAGFWFVTREFNLKLPSLGCGQILHAVVMVVIAGFIQFGIHADKYCFTSICIVQTSSIFTSICIVQNSSTFRSKIKLEIECSLRETAWFLSAFLC